MITGFASITNPTTATAMLTAFYMHVSDRMRIEND